MLILVANSSSDWTREQNSRIQCGSIRSQWQWAFKTSNHKEREIGPRVQGHERVDQFDPLNMGKLFCCGCIFQKHLNGRWDQQLEGWVWLFRNQEERKKLLRFRHTAMVTTRRQAASATPDPKTPQNAPNPNPNTRNPRTPFSTTAIISASVKSVKSHPNTLLLMTFIHTCALCLIFFGNFLVGLIAWLVAGKGKRKGLGCWRSFF